MPMIVGAVLSGEGQFWYLWFIFFVISYKLGFDWFATAVFAGGVMEILCGNIVSERILNVKIIFAALGMIAARVLLCAFSSGDRAFGSGPEGMGSSPIRHIKKEDVLLHPLFVIHWQLRNLLRRPHGLLYRPQL